jgi:hypothetical protein
MQYRRSIQSKGLPGLQVKFIELSSQYLKWLQVEARPDDKAKMEFATIGL